jgi:DNA-binding transcriptional ArsR family regulator
MGKKRDKRSRRGPKVDREALFAFLLEYLDGTFTAHGANAAAAKHFGVTPATISYHVRKLQENPRIRKALKDNESIFRPRRSLDRKQLIKFMHDYRLRHFTTYGMYAAAADYFGVTRAAIRYHVKKLNLK